MSFCQVILIFRKFAFMKKMFHKISATSLALLLLVITTSWKVEKHYCMGHLIDVAFFVPAETCGMDMSTTESEDDHEVVQNSCCDETIIAVEGQNDVKPSIHDINLEQQIFLAAYTYTYLSLFEPLAFENLPHEYYLPPDIVKDIQLLDAVFLI